MAPRVLIAGGGLSGLCAARHLANNNIEFQLIEARERLGGRIRVEPAISQEFRSDAFTPSVDLGPSWFWPGQAHMAQLVEELNLANSVYSQESEGLSVIEYGNGTIEKAQGAASMEGSYRLDGGIHRLIDSLLTQVSGGGEITTEAQLVSVSQTSEGIAAQVSVGSEQRMIESELLVIAIPPRVVSHAITFTPQIPGIEEGRLNTIPTWMAAHAKLVLVYDQPFWQSEGLSGDAFSQIGPLVEIHDASPRSSDRHALFGFVGVDATQRRGKEEQIKAAAIEQLVRLFGPEAAHTQDVYFTDWALEPFTCTAHDLRPAGKPTSAQSLPTTEWDSKVLWAGTETAALGAHSNGYLEGAVEAGLRAAKLAIEKLA